MDKREFEALTKVEALIQGPIFLRVEDFSKETDGRTLLYGYTCDRETFHVYSFFSGEIYIHVYRNIGGKAETVRLYDVSSEGLQSLQDLIPNKRLYPQYCDGEFCTYLKERGVTLPFTTWADPDSRGDQWYVGVVG